MPPARNSPHRTSQRPSLKIRFGAGLCSLRDMPCYAVSADFGLIYQSWWINQSINLSINQSTEMPIDWLIDLFIYWSIRLITYLSIHPSIHPSTLNPKKWMIFKTSPSINFLATRDRLFQEHDIKLVVFGPWEIGTTFTSSFIGSLQLR